jgi:hypothetical protein
VAARGLAAAVLLTFLIVRLALSPTAAAVAPPALFALRLLDATQVCRGQVSVILLWSDWRVDLKRRTPDCAATGFPRPVPTPKQLGLGFNKTSQQLCRQF